MATKLQCEICGGKLVGKPGGIFECENCGTEYTTEWAKAKIQEITGTVKVEGTVEVTGKVQVEGGTVQVDTSANRDALLKRAFLMLEDSQWEKASELFDQVLNLDPECGEAYLGKLMTELCVNRPEQLKDCSEPFGNLVSYQRAVRYGNSAVKSEVSSCLTAIQDRLREDKTRLEKELEDIDTMAENYQKRIEASKKQRASDQTEINNQIAKAKFEIDRLTEEKKKVGLFKVQEKNELAYRIKEKEKQVVQLNDKRERIIANNNRECLDLGNQLYAFRCNSKVKAIRARQRLNVIDYLLANGSSINKKMTVGEQFVGTVTEIREFGAFMRIKPNVIGLLHISRITKERIEDVGDVLNVGDQVLVRIFDIDPKTGKIGLTCL